MTPRVAVHTAGTPRRSIAESKMMQASAPRSSLLEEVDDRVAADLFLAVAREAQVDRQPAFGREQLRALEQRPELALVVRDAARVQPLAAHGRLERLALPELERRRRLHVEVAVDEDRRRVCGSPLDARISPTTSGCVSPGSTSAVAAGATDEVRAPTPPPRARAARARDPRSRSGCAATPRARRARPGPRRGSLCVAARRPASARPSRRRTSSVGDVAQRLRVARRTAASSGSGSRSGGCARASR